MFKRRTRVVIESLLELGYPNGTVPVYIMAHEDLGIFARVPVDKVRRLIISHGGLVD